MAAAANASGGGTAITSVEKSALFQSANSESLNRTFSSGGNRKTWTSSIWFTRGGKNGGDNSLFTGYGNGSQGAGFYISNDTSVDTLNFYNYYSGGWTAYFVATPKFRDLGWYHVVIVWDTTQVVASERMRAYVNGERITEFIAVAYPSLNLDGFLNQAQQYCVGSLTGSAYYMDGYIAETVFIDGTAYEPSSFGEFDSTGLYWTPKSSTAIKELSFGVNGFYLSNEYDVSSNMTTFVDSGPTTHTITTVGNATHSPLGQKVQNSVIYLDGSGDSFKTAQSGHADFTFGTGTFCIEGWFNRTALSGTSNYSYVMDFRYAGYNADRPAIYMDGSNNINYDLNNIKITSSTDPSLGAWFHLAVARNGSTTTMYLNGTSVGSFTDTVDYLVGRPWFFQYPQSNAYGFNGYATEIRISKGVPRYTGNFTPATTAFVSDSNTSLLVHSDKFFGVANDSNTPPNNFTNVNTVTKVATCTPTACTPAEFTWTMSSWLSGIARFTYAVPRL